MVIYFLRNTYGVAVFNKKPIFTVANAEIMDFKYKNIETVYVLEKGHRLNVEQKEWAVTHGKHELERMFYSKQEKVKNE